VVNKQLKFFSTLLLVLSVVSSPWLGAQGITEERPAGFLQLEAFRHTDGIRLRWYAKDPYVWALGRRDGYLLERRQLAADGDHGDWIMIPDTLLREVEKDGWRDIVEQDSIALMFPAVALDRAGRIDYLGEGEDDRQLLATVNDRNTAYLFVLMATDLSYPAARGGALGFTDATAEDNELYEYRIAVAGTDYRSVPLRVRAGGRETLFAPERLTVEFGDRRATLTWPGESYRYRSFDVYRREGEEGKWELRNEVRLQVQGDLEREMVFRDSLEDNETTYAYALVGYNRFGVASRRGRMVSGRGDAPNPLPAINIHAEETGYRKATIDWSYLGGDSTLIDYVEVFRSYTSDGGRERVAGPLEPSTKDFTDTLLQDDQFYTVRAHGPRGDFRTSFSAYVLASDSVPPPPPTGLFGSLDTAGIVSLGWTHSTADDVMGYRVFYSNSRERAGTRLTPNMETVNGFDDTLSNLVQLPDSIYYRVVALDERENAGEFSEVLAIPVPDLKPPAPPRLRTFEADTNGVYLTFAPSSSADVVRYLLQRRATGTTYWADLETLPATGEVARIFDGDARANLRMEYRLVAIDEAGLRGYSNTLIARKVPRGVYPAVTGLEGEALRREQRVRLIWRYANDPDIRQFRILRSPGGAELTTYRTLAVAEVDRREANRAGLPAEWRFLDEELDRDTTYRYAVQPVYYSGALGRLGEIIEVNY
jgi:hypothetical protein